MLFLTLLRVAPGSSITSLPSKPKVSLIFILLHRRMIFFLDSSPPLEICFPWVMRTIIPQPPSKRHRPIYMPLHSLASLWVLLNCVSSFITCSGYLLLCNKTPQTQLHKQLFNAYRYYGSGRDGLSTYCNLGAYRFRFSCRWLKRLSAGIT